MRNFIGGLALALLGAVLVMGDADAARLGGGRSVGAQRSITSAPPASAPARQVQQAAPAQQPAASPNTQPAPAGGVSKWMPILGGLALGGILGSLFGGSALSGMLLSLAMIALLGVAVMFVVRMLAQRRAPGASPTPYAAGGAQGHYASVLGNETVAAPPPSQASGFEVLDPAPHGPSVPAGFDVTGFLRAAKLNFMKLQTANDAGDLDELREFTTPDLYEELKKDVLERSAGRQQTDVVALNADLLEVVTEGGRHWASVRFSGTIRDTSASVPGGFEEVWNLAKPTDGSSGWVLAGIQQMH
ncbi:MAG: Tim44 domain-containing protein [Betaproteobacteria bacterium]|nr:Tim44 domain-containing protein [Betaproteobacteria bacterium]